MITVLSVADNPRRWEDFMAIHSACVEAGIPEPAERCIALGVQPEGWREDHSIDILAAYLHNGHAIVDIDGVLFDHHDAINEIKNRKVGATLLCKNLS